MTSAHYWDSLNLSPAPFLLLTVWFDERVVDGESEHPNLTVREKTNQKTNEDTPTCLSPIGYDCIISGTSCSKGVFTFSLFFSFFFPSLIFNLSPVNVVAILFSLWRRPAVAQKNSTRPIQTTAPRRCWVKIYWRKRNNQRSTRWMYLILKNWTSSVYTSRYAFFLNIF